MLTQFRVFAAAHAQQGNTLRRGLAALVLAASIQGCTTVPPSTIAGPDPSDVRIAVQSTRYRSIIGPFVSQRPAEPAAWRELNDSVAPARNP